MSEPSVVEEIFLAALEKGTAAERAAFLEDACKDNADLRGQVERLLDAHPNADKFLEPPMRPNDDVAATYVPINECAGVIIAGRYKLIEPIGEGGMGSVWMAQQTEPVKRLVAIKLIKAGMDTKAVLARFEAERQALAMMDHPNIAKVLDAGASDEGRPFFVMELVKGVPITQYCDERKLTLRQRLELFILVCQAVQHAHQKGVIHRDLKPSNVLVSQYDDCPVPKVIDFGVAKAAGQPLTDRTLVTGFGAIVGTPEYMSPEQAQFNQLDVDTRSDIYALGVLLYELLTGSTPVNRIELEKAGVLEILRMIREQEPPRPSARLSSSATLPRIAAARGSEPRTIAGLLRNDLDWIVMKSLEKDRNRRYETATGLAADIQRYLKGEAVHAHPPSTAYRMRKFVRKHRAVIATASAFLGLLIAAVAISSVLAVKANHNFKIANAVKLNLTDALNESQLTSASLQIDMDLAEMETNQPAGLLRLASTLKSIKLPDGETTPTPEAAVRRRELCEFSTMAILAAGQNFVPLMPLIPRDGHGIKSASHNGKGVRYITLGLDMTAKLWDPYTGRQIGVLNRGDEKTLEVGFSSDGATVYTHSLDGVIRLWSSDDGAFRTEFEPRPNLRETIVPFPSDSSSISTSSKLIDVQLADDRVITRRRIHKETLNHAYEMSSGQLELWDANTGKFIASLEPESSQHSFIGDGRWICMSGYRADSQEILLAANGIRIATLKCDPEQGRYERPPSVSADGRFAATVSYIDDPEKPQENFVHVWDTTTWELASTKGPFKTPLWYQYLPEWNQWIANDRFLTPINGHAFAISQTGAVTVMSINELPLTLSLATNGGFALSGLEVYDEQTGRRMKPPKGRKSHPEISRFAPDGRLLIYQDPFYIDSGHTQLFDTRAEKIVVSDSLEAFYKSGVGWVWFAESHPNKDVYRLPTSDRLEISPHLLELWAQVAVRGQLDDEGLFVKWDDLTWETKRQELAAMPAPYPDFPFPGHIATDKLHWLRTEYEHADDADKLPLAQQLLDRAGKAGDQAESVRWRNIISAAKIPSADTDAE